MIMILNSNYFFILFSPIGNKALTTKHNNRVVKLASLIAVIDFDDFRCCAMYLIFESFV